MGTWKHQIAENDVLELTGFVNDAHAAPGLSQIDYRYQQIGLQLARAYALGEGHARTWGFDARVDLLDTSNADPFLLSKSFVSTGIVGLYLQDD